MYSRIAVGNEVEQIPYRDAYLQLNLETLEANRALYSEEEIKDHIELYGFSPFQLFKHKAGAMSYTCSRVRLSPEEVAIGNKVDQWSGKRQDRERTEQKKAEIILESLETRKISDDEEAPLEYDIPDPRTSWKSFSRRRRPKR